MNDRARVPFALVGVLMLVSSATLTATVGTHSPQRTPDVDRAMEGATTELVPSLRGAADEAATDAAAAPVTRPANTTAGRALDESRSFRDALRLRIYLAAMDRIEAVSVRRGETVALASLPPVERTTEGFREAIDRVKVEPAGEDGAALRVEIQGVTLEAIRDGRPVATDVRSPTFVVANPALLLHERTERFERRANAAVTGPGAGRRLTARLSPIAWARGYAQYGGAPIANVVANRHVEFATNDALLAEQRAVFGDADPDGERATAAAGRHVAATDLVVGAGGEAEWVDRVHGGTGDVAVGPDANQSNGVQGDRRIDPETTVGIDSAADRAYAKLVGIDEERLSDSWFVAAGRFASEWEADYPLADATIGGEPPSASVGVPHRHTGEADRDLPEIVERVHTVEARLAADRRQRGVSKRRDGRPGPDWRLVGERTAERVDLSTAEGSPPTSEEWSTRDGAVYDATVTETRTRRWRRGNETATTESVVEHEFRIRLGVQARTVPVAGAPDGALDGALSEATDRATDRAVASAGGLRGAARSAAVGETLPRSTATAAPTVGRVELEADLRTVRDRTRNISVTLPAPAIGTGRGNPSARLREELEEREDELRGEDGADARQRTVAAVRTAYLDALDARLEVRAAVHAETNAGIRRALAEHLGADGLDGALDAHGSAERPEARELTDPAGNLSLSVDTAPAYLPTAEVDRDRLTVRGGGSVHPLAARNVNAFTSPQGRVAESIVDRIPFLGVDRVALSTAAEALAATDVDRRSEREALRREVASANAYVRGELRAAMVEEGVPEGDARAALETDAAPASAALRIANGSVVDSAVDSVDAERIERDRLRVRLETTLDDTLTDERARPRRETSNRAVEAAREAYRKKLETTIGRGVETGTERARKRALGEKLGSIPAGLPVAPVPGYWYATANVWYVDVGGTYERFAVRSDRGDPTGAVTYLRDGRTARVTHGGDAVRLGSAEHVSFRTETAVIVVVPAGGSGVGDMGGEMDERSPGWPPE